MSGLQLKAFVAECWVSNGRLFYTGDGKGRRLRREGPSPSDSWHAAAAGRGTCGGLRIDISEYAGGEPCVDETSAGLEQGIVIHPYVLFQGLETRVITWRVLWFARGTLRPRSDSRVVNGVDMFIHKFLQVGLGVQDVEVVVPYQLVRCASWGGCPQLRALAFCGRLGVCFPSQPSIMVSSPSNT